METGTTTDRIEKTITLRAPRSRVWRALTVAEEFGEWFRVKLEGPFVEGATVRGRITHPGYEHLTMEIMVERLDPERYFAYRWHPYAINPGVDYSQEPTTLVDRIPLSRRAEAFRMNDNGWSEQLKNIERHVSQP